MATGFAIWLGGRLHEDSRWFRAIFRQIAVPVHTCGWPPPLARTDFDNSTWVKRVGMDRLARAQTQRFSHKRWYWHMRSEESMLRVRETVLPFLNAGMTVRKSYICIHMDIRDEDLYSSIHTPLASTTVLSKWIKKRKERRRKRRWRRRLWHDNLHVGNPNVAKDGATPDWPAGQQIPHIPPKCRPCLRAGVTVDVFR